MEQGTGIEPAFTAWEAVVLPIYEPCKCGYYNKADREIQPLFVEKYARCAEQKKTVTFVTVLIMGWVMGLEPTTPGTTIQCSAN